jgi:hypothetical protein
MFFPYLYCKFLNKESKLKTLPPINDYLPDGMNLEKHNTFQQWYTKNVDTPFCLKDALTEYCENDTLILMKAVTSMRRILVDITGGYDVLPNARSIAGLALAVYQKCFLPSETIAIIPDGGYEKWDKSSDIALKLMNWISMDRNVVVQHAGNGREFKIGLLKVDGYIESKNLVLEFLGCYFHSHPSCTISTETAPNGKTNSLNYDDTILRIEEIKKMGYNVEVFWECDVEQELTTNKEMRLFFDECEAQGAIS